MHPMYTGQDHGPLGSRLCRRGAAGQVGSNLAALEAGIPLEAITPTDTASIQETRCTALSIFVSDGSSSRLSASCAACPPCQASLLAEHPAGTAHTGNIFHARSACGAINITHSPYPSILTATGTSLASAMATASLVLPGIVAKAARRAALDGYGSKRTLAHLIFLLLAVSASRRDTFWQRRVRTFLCIFLQQTRQTACMNSHTHMHKHTCPGVCLYFGLLSHWAPAASVLPACLRCSTYIHTANRSSGS
jgi:hypothetical protein